MVTINESGRGGAIVAEVLQFAFFAMLWAYFVASAVDAACWIMLENYQAALWSAGLAGLFLRLVFCISEFMRRMIDPGVTVWQFLRFCLKLLAPFLLKSVKNS